MNKLSLIIDKSVVIVLFLFMFIDFMPGVEINILAFLVPLLITGTLRVFIITMVLLMNLISIANEGSKKLFKRNKNRDKG